MLAGNKMVAAGSRTNSPVRLEVKKEVKMSTLATMNTRMKKIKMLAGNKRASAGRIKKIVAVGTTRDIVAVGTTGEIVAVGTTGETVAAGTIGRIVAVGRTGEIVA